MISDLETVLYMTKAVKAHCSPSTVAQKAQKKERDSKSNTALETISIESDVGKWLLNKRGPLASS